MTPTIVLKDGKPFLVTGSPGGSRIITAVLQVMLNVIDRRMDIAGAVSAPRIHNQWVPDQVYVEPGVPDERRGGTAGARRQGRAATAVHLGQFDPGHAARIRRRRRSTRGRRSCSRLLSAPRGENSFQLRHGLKLIFYL